MFDLSDVERAILCELLVRGPQTSAAVRSNSERLFGMPSLAEVDALVSALSEWKNGPLVRKLPRLAGQKEARWAQLLSGEPVAAEADVVVAPMTVAVTIPAEVEQRLKHWRPRCSSCAVNSLNCAARWASSPRGTNGCIASRSALLIHRHPTKGRSVPVRRAQ